MKIIGIPKAGDVVQNAPDGVCYNVNETDGGGNAKQVIIVRRPWPEGKTEADMLEVVETAIRKCVYAEIENDGRSIGAYVLLWRGKHLEDDLRTLREAIEAYELGKPPESDK